MRILTLLLIPFSWLYGCMMWVRNACYDAGILRTVSVSVPVISVGNMTTGGTGKTPMVEYLVRYCSKRKKKTAVISRGYKRATTGTVIVSDGKRILTDSLQAGDEPYQIAKKFSEAIVIVDEQRARAAQIAVEQFHVDVIVLDDGFQHRSLKRDLDIVMIDGQHSLRDTYMLPAGSRREPLRGLRRAKITAFSRPENFLQQMEDLRSYGTTQFVNIRYQPVRLRHCVGSETVELSAVRETSCVAFCGIGNPQSFRTTLQELGINIKLFVSFSDHYQYTFSDIESVRKQAVQLNAKYIFTTEKDAARMQTLPHSDVMKSLPLYYLEIEAEIVDGVRVFEEKLDQLLRRTAV